MKVIVFLLCLFALSGYCTRVKSECIRPGQQCLRELSCGFAQACPFGETVQGVCSADLTCIIEGDACVPPGSDYSRGVYKKDEDGKFYCARIVR